MKSNKRRRAELDRERLRRRVRTAEKRRREKAEEMRTKGLHIEHARLNLEGVGLTAGGFLSRDYYGDLPYRCRDCGVEQVWTAADQKWWFETVRAPLWTRAVRCLDCRRATQRRS